ncbi:MAG: DUF4403 family protein [Polyangiaceae bacterium]|jgi:hypothetical protein
MRPYVTLFASLATSLVVLALPGCSRFGPVYPPRPLASEGAPLADPEPARIVTHVAVTSAAMRAALDDAAPKTGEGTFPLLGASRGYTWERGALVVGFSQGRVVLTTKIQVRVALPLEKLEVPLELRIEAEPIVSSGYAIKLQSVDVHVTSSDARLALADRIAGIYGKIADAIGEKLRDFTYDLRPLLEEAYARVSRPIDLPVGEARACARLKVLEVEAGPTVLADGLEKDLALVVAPSITMPCPDLNEDGAPPLPPLSNVASLAPGPFTVTIPIAARYDELTRAMTMAFTDGKLFFSAEYPQIYLEKPEIYESQGSIVLRLHLAGPVHKLGIDADLDGDLYLTGHPAVVDNELRVPDLEPTIETRSFLLSLKAMTDGDRIREQARAALRLDMGERLRDARAKLGDGLTFGTEKGCFRGDVDRVEVTGIYPHAAYLRVYVAVTAHARATFPCSSPLP